MKILIALPLAILILVSLLSMMGLGSTDQFLVAGEDFDDTFTAAVDGWYDLNGHQVAKRLWNYHEVGEAGGPHSSDGKHYWLNETNVGAYGWRDKETVQAAGNLVYSYPIFWVLENETLASVIRGDIIPFDTASNLGIIALITGVIALALVVGIRVLGVGVSDVSVSTAVMATAFLSLWAMASLGSIELITAIPLVGPIIYFTLTGMYTLGILSQIGGSGDGM